MRNMIRKSASRLIVSRPTVARALILLTLLTVVANQSSSAESRKSKPVIPVFSLSAPVSESPMAMDSPFALGAMPESLKDLVARIDKARDDKNVPGIVLLMGGGTLGRAQGQELVRALNDLRAAGKTVHTHADTVDSSGRFAIVAGTEMSVVPTGYMFINGLYGEQMFLRGLLDKVGIEPDFDTRGEYKSAAEQFMRNEPSPAAAKMAGWLYTSIFDNDVAAIAAGRGVSNDQARDWIDTGVFMAEDAKVAGIIDQVEHREDFEARLRDKYGEDLKLDRKYGKKRSTTIDLSSPFGIMQFYADLLSPPVRRKSTKDAVGIVYIEGPIMSGSGTGSLFGSAGIAYSTPIRKALDEVADDDSIKAVVLRVDSPGGSAVASEIMLAATKRIAAKKPLVVSMGNVAGSGGYYVTCAAETIFADPSTITGSIGVVSGKLATTGAWDKVGINFVPIKHGKNSGMLSSYTKFSDSERAAMSGYMDKVYDVFKDHVTSIRGDRLKKPIDELAGGRVFSGTQALELGLVDKLGGLSDAIAHAAKEAKLADDEFEIRVVPRVKNFFEELMAGASGASDDSGHLRLSGVSDPIRRALLPALENLDPERVRAVTTAVQLLGIAEQENCLMAMPVLSIR